MKNKYAWIRQNDDDCDDPFEKMTLSGNRHDTENHNYTEGKQSRVIYDTQNFKCRNCGLFVIANRELSGVNNRNHCPRCLWSRHMDLLTAGDRKSECKSRMEPIGLTCKQTNKRYGMNVDGELMLIHRCIGCDKVSINRIAADDDIQAISQVYQKSLLLEMDIREILSEEGVFLLGAHDSSRVYRQLFGLSGELHEMMESMLDSRNFEEYLQPG
jgi:hypothetical protein